MHYAPILAHADVGRAPDREDVVKTDAGTCKPGSCGARLSLLSSSLIVLLLIALPCVVGSCPEHQRARQFDSTRAASCSRGRSVQGDAYDQVLGLATNFFLTGMPTAPNGMKLYYSESYANHTDPLTGAGWPHNPAGLYSMLTDSGLLYYAYSGNVAMANLVRDVLTFDLDHGLTPSTWNWPGVPFASGDSGALTYQGAQVRQLHGSGGRRRRHRARQGRRDRRRVPEVLRVQRSRPLPGRGGEGGRRSGEPRSNRQRHAVPLAVSRLRADERRSRAVQRARDLGDCSCSTS